MRLVVCHHGFDFGLTSTILALQPQLLSRKGFCEVPNLALFFLFSLHYLSIAFPNLPDALQSKPSTALCYSALLYTRRFFLCQSFVV